MTNADVVIQGGKICKIQSRTTNQNTAIDKAKQHCHELMAQQYAGKTYQSLEAVLNPNHTLIM